MKRNFLPRNFLVLALLALAALPAYGAEPRPLLTFLDSGKRAAAPPPGIAGIAARRPVRVDLSALATNPRLELLDGTVYETQRTGSERRGDNDFTWRGRVLSEGKEVGQMTLTAVAGKTAATITVPSGVYQIEPTAAGGQDLVEIDEGALPACHGAVEAPVHGSGLPPHKGKAAATSTIDVLVFYTHPTLVALGSVDAVRATVQDSIDMSNTAYQNSQVNARVRLVGLQELPVFAQETAGLSQDELEAFQPDSTVDALRRQTGADVVSLFLENMSDACGIGYVMNRDALGPEFAPYAANVIRRRCGHLTLAHEIGHNLGCEHDPENSGTTPAEASFPYSFGHFVDKVFHTVMAYPNACGSGCPEIPNFSNPNVLYKGLPTGIPDQRDNHRTIENTRDLVASFGNLSTGPTTPCKAAADTLCLMNRRFQVRLSWENQFDGSSGVGRAIPRTDLTGFWSFGDPSNVELMIKILDFGDAIKVFYGELTDLHFTLTVADTKTGQVKIYSNTAGDCGAIDQSAFAGSAGSTGNASGKAASRLLSELLPASLPAAKASGSCRPNANTLCLMNGRFAVSVDWANPGNSTSGKGGAVPLSTVTGAFYFTDPSNLELLGKILDFGDRIAFFYGTLSDLEYTLTVEDTVGGTVRTYHNAAGNFCGGLDNHAF